MPREENSPCVVGVDEQRLLNEKTCFYLPFFQDSGRKSSLSLSRNRMSVEEDDKNTEPSYC